MPDAPPAEAPSEPHVHAEDGLDAVARARAVEVPPPGARTAGPCDRTAWRDEDRLLETATQRASRTRAPRPPDPGRALDVLIDLGRLQV